MFFQANGEGILTPDKKNDKILPHGILYLSAYSQRDSLEHPAAQPIITSWQKYGTEVAKGKTLREWLRLLFFKDVH